MGSVGYNVFSLWILVRVQLDNWLIMSYLHRWQKPSSKYVEYNNTD